MGYIGTGCTGEGGLAGVGDGEVHLLADLDTGNTKVEPLLEDYILQLRVRL